jgi:peptide/nickel transport system substrate-binding protein
MPTATPEPKILTVCMPHEPDSLYVYGTDDLAAQHVWQAIYDGPLDSRAYAYQPVILTELPSLAGGSAVLETVTVQAGERVLAADGAVTPLSPGVTVRDVAGQRVTFDGTPVLMQRLVVTFTLQSNLYWSDGVLLTADDSVYSFELAAHPATPTDKYVVERTAAYRAVDPRTAVWNGVPGFLDHFYFLNFWRPLPRHAWGGLSAAELLTATLSTRQPLGWGPFVLREWAPGDHIAVARNPLYFRATQGLPRLDEVVFRFIADPALLAAELVAGRCDVVTHEAADAVSTLLPTPSPVVTATTYDARWELLAFGISPAHERPDFFEDVRVRLGIAQCINHQALADLAQYAPGRVLDSFVPPDHPLYAGSTLTIWGYDPAAGQHLLATAGWYDEDGDGVREAHGIPGIADGALLSVSYYTTDDPLRVRVAQRIQADLAACGVQVAVQSVPSDALFAPGPEGLLFGRRFDLAQFAWHAQTDPLCDLFLSGQVPDAGHWDRPNVAGFLDDEYDTACLSALEALPDSPAYAAGQMEAQRIFSARLPVLPLFQRLEIVLARASLIGLSPDPAQPSELWNIEQLDLRH